jgi:hypothetical protein
MLPPQLGQWRVLVGEFIVCVIRVKVQGSRSKKQGSRVKVQEKRNKGKGARTDIQYSRVTV